MLVANRIVRRLLRFEALHIFKYNVLSHTLRPPAIGGGSSSNLLTLVLFLLKASSSLSSDDSYSAKKKASPLLAAGAVVLRSSKAGTSGASPRVLLSAVIGKPAKCSAVNCGGWAAAAGACLDGFA